MVPIIYSRRAAADYAVKWAARYNPAFPSHAKNDCPDCGGDCTNFVSQALYAGGWPMDAPAPGWDGWYSYKERPGFAYPDTSHPWAGAVPFSLYLIASHRGFRCKRSDLDLGDVVQGMSNNNGHIFHTAIVTKFESTDYTPVPAIFESAAGGLPFFPVPTNKILYISSHTKDRTNYPLTEWENGIKKAGGSPIYWKIADVVPGRPQWLTHLL
jgi:Putative amidase domain